MSETKTDTKTTANYEALDARLSEPPQEIENLESLLRKLPAEDQKEVSRIL